MLTSMSKYPDIQISRHPGTPYPRTPLSRCGHVLCIVCPQGKKKGVCFLEGVSKNSILMVLTSLTCPTKFAAGKGLAGSSLPKME